MDWHTEHEQEPVLPEVSATPGSVDEGLSINYNEQLLLVGNTYVDRQIKELETQQSFH